MNKNFLWLAPFLSFLSGYYLINYFFQINDIEVPHIVGKSLIEGSKILSDNNLNLRILAHKEDADHIEGTILDQIPINQKIKPNQSIYILLSKKPKDFIVPELRGKNLLEINKILNSQKIRSKVYYLENIATEKQCIGQFPLPGESINQNEKMILYLSSGNKKPVMIPNFKGLNLKEIINFLSLYNIKPSIFTHPGEVYDQNKNYTVIDQRPLPGTLMQLSENLNIQLQV